MLLDDRRALTDAMGFALDSHGGQTRKGTSIPYVSHLAQVAGLVLEHGGTPALAVAALLHDVVEDTEVDAATVRARFGAEVARIVELLTDTLEDDVPGRKAAWIDRKQPYLARLAGADRDARLVAACDKLHNLRSLVADLERDGAETLERFTATPRQTRWYFEEISRVVVPGLPESLVREIGALLTRLQSYVPEADPQP